MLLFVDEIAKDRGCRGLVRTEEGGYMVYVGRGGEVEFRSRVVERLREWCESFDVAFELQANAAPRQPRHQSAMRATDDQLHFCPSLGKAERHYSL